MATINTIPLIVIAGPTASGKTALAISLAEQFGGEIICADSRTIYKGMNIGTAKPTPEEQARVPHWGIDLVAPNERYTVADFKVYAEQKIEEIRSRGHIPFLVGGTGLYINAVVYDYQFGVAADPLLRSRLEQLSISELQDYCHQHSIQLPENNRNKRYLIRAIEQNGINDNRSYELINDVVFVGITTDKEILRTRILQRSEQLFDDGVVEEAIMLGKKYGWDNEAMTGNIYPLVSMYLQNELSLSEMQEKFVTLDWRLAKRQLTWLRRDKNIRWLSLNDAEHYLSEILAR